MDRFENNSEVEITINPRNKIKSHNVRVFVADDSKPMLEAIIGILTPHFEIVGTAADGKAALEMIGRLKPDVAILDISMPFKTGIEIASDLQISAPAVKVVIISAHDDESYIRAANNAGALAYVVKTRLGSELVPAIERVSAGNTFAFPDADKVNGNGHSSNRS